VSRELKLRKVDQTQVQKVSVVCLICGPVAPTLQPSQNLTIFVHQATPAEQRVFLTGLLLKIQEHQEMMVAPDTTFQLSKKLEVHIPSKMHCSPSF
jgi:hypothetical protein